MADNSEIPAPAPAAGAEGGCEPPSNETGKEQHVLKSPGEGAGDDPTTPNESETLKGDPLLAGQDKKTPALDELSPSTPHAILSTLDTDEIPPSTKSKSPKSLADLMLSQEKKALDAPTVDELASATEHKSPDTNAELPSSENKISPRPGKDELSEEQNALKTSSTNAVLQKSSDRFKSMDGVSADGKEGGATHEKGATSPGAQQAASDSPVDLRRARTATENLTLSSTNEEAGAAPAPPPDLFTPTADGSLSVSSSTDVDILASCASTPVDVSAASTDPWRPSARTNMRRPSFCLPPTSVTLTEVDILKSCSDRPTLYGTLGLKAFSTDHSPDVCKETGKSKAELQTLSVCRGARSDKNMPDLSKSAAEAVVRVPAAHSSPNVAASDLDADSEPVKIEHDVTTLLLLTGGDVSAGETDTAGLEAKQHSVGANASFVPKPAQSLGAETSLMADDEDKKATDVEMQDTAESRLTESTHLGAHADAGAADETFYDVSLDDDIAREHDGSGADASFTTPPHALFEHDAHITGKPPCYPGLRTRSHSRLPALSTRQTAAGMAHGRLPQSDTDIKFTSIQADVSRGSENSEGWTGKFRKSIAGRPLPDDARWPVNMQGERGEHPPQQKQHMYRLFGRRKFKFLSTPERETGGGREHAHTEIKGGPPVPDITTEEAGHRVSRETRTRRASVFRPAHLGDDSIQVTTMEGVRLAADVDSLPYGKGAEATYRRRWTVRRAARRVGRCLRDALVTFTTCRGRGETDDSDVEVRGRRVSLSARAGGSQGDTAAAARK